MITKIRAISQQLEKPQFTNPKDLVAWMGAMQGQDYTMAKWAVGIRLKNGKLSEVDEALRKGEILRTHVMRPTWHLVASEDIRWMLKLTGSRIKAAVESYGRSFFEIPAEMRVQGIERIGRLLEGGNSLTKQELLEALNQQGFDIDTHRLGHLLTHAETDAFVCSGVDKGKKATYALLDERVAPTPELTKEESLARLAHNYFRSHSPASLADFTWWSGLPITEARQAIALIASELVDDKISGELLYVHDSCPGKPSPSKSVHLLPPFDEYLISYKDRTDVLELAHHPQAFTNNGIFYPVLMSKGKVVGNWSKTIRKDRVTVDYSAFNAAYTIDEELLQKAILRYQNFLFSR